MSMKMATRGLLAVPLRGVSRSSVGAASAAAARVGSSSSSSRLSLSTRSFHQQRAVALDSTRSHTLLFKPAPARFAAASPIILSSRSISTTSSTSNTSSSSKPSTPPPQPEAETEDTDSPPPKATLRERLKFLTRRYGWWALGVYLLASSVDFSLTFLAIHLLGADHIRSLESSLRKSIGLEQRSEDPDESSETTADKPGNKNSTIWTEAVLAYTIHKTLLLPVRVAFTAAVTPSFVKWLVKMGWAKANHQVKAQVGRKAADKAIQEVVRRNNAVNKAGETVKHQ